MMTKALLLAVLLFSLEARTACLSGSLIVSEPSAHFNLKHYEEAVQDFESSIKAEIPTDLSLVINLEPLNPRVNAEIIKTDDDLVVQIMGGMLMHPKMNEDTLKLVLCHEIGHYLGGPPLKSRNGWSSTEGQADYYSALKCAREFAFDEETFLTSAHQLASIYAEVTREPTPRLDSCDTKVVDRINYGYPSVQCRLDTMVAGWQGKERPKCWFRE